jgi:ubiquinone/menaquinone biosynthesis C-methylase UbiE
LTGPAGAPGYVDAGYLRDMAQLLYGLKERTYTLLRAAPDSRVLDVGCGPGTDTVPLARLLGAPGRVVGVDRDEVMLAQAARRAHVERVQGRALHVRADAAGGLPFAANTFDACRSERLFQHLRQPERALAEMARVTRPGGWVVVLDTDHSVKSFDTPEVDVERRLVRWAAENLHANGYSGRTLYRLFRRARLADIAVEAVAIAFTDLATARQANRLDDAEAGALAAGVVTPSEVGRWRASLEAAQARGEFFATGGGVLIAGRKP